MYIPYKMTEASSLRNCLEKRPDDVSPEKCKGDPASSLESQLISCVCLMMDPVGKKGRQFTQPSKSSRGEMACPVLANCQVLPAPLPIPGFRTSAAGLGNFSIFLGPGLLPMKNQRDSGAPLMY